MYKKDKVFPVLDQDYKDLGIDLEQYYASLAMQGLLAGKHDCYDDIGLAKKAFSIARAMIKVNEEL